MGNEDVRVRGIAARAGGWSARHRWAAVGVWVLFVVLTMGIGSAMGSVEVRDSDQLKGRPARRPTSSRRRGSRSPPVRLC